MRPDKTRGAVMAFLAMLATCSWGQSAPSDNDLRMAGECGTLGAAVMQNGDSFPDSMWRQAALALMLSPAVLADAKLEVPFKDHPIFKQAVESTKADLASQPPSPSSPAYSRRLKPCLDWATKLPALDEQKGERR